MKKKILCSFILCLLFLSGCGKVSEKDVVNKFEKKLMMFLLHMKKMINIRLFLLIQLTRMSKLF